MINHQSMNRYLSLMARSIEMAIISSGSLYVETFLENAETSVASELEGLRRIQLIARLHSNKENDLGALTKYLFAWHDADRFFRCVGLKSCDDWFKGYKASMYAAKATTATFS